MSPTGSLADSPSGYGPVSRALHWGMAALFAWQFVGASLHFVARGTPTASFFWWSHHSIGFSLWVLVLLRGAWGLANMRQRPEHEGPRAERLAAKFGHLALYGLMVAVPTVAILRAVGSTRGLKVFGIELVAPRAEAIQGLVTLGDDWHGLLGWTLLAFVIGHVGMALHHGFARRDGTLRRMARGRVKAA